jgi:dTDP-4-amino-4,6-dideoxygalactose transaminase
MPTLCQSILESCDWKKIAQSRQRNYRLLSELIPDGPVLRRVMPHLPDTVIPWAFAVFLENRVLHEQALRQLGVPLFTFGEALHPLLDQSDATARKDARHLSERLLMLPIHHNLREEDIVQYAVTINEFVRGLA